MNKKVVLLTGGELRHIESSDLLNKPQALPRYDCNQFKYGQVKI